MPMHGLTDSRLKTPIKANALGKPEEEANGFIGPRKTVSKVSREHDDD